MAGLSSAGLEIKTLEEIKTAQSVKVRAAISPRLNTGSKAPIGEVIGAGSSEAREVWEVIQAIYAAQDPDQASGDALTILCKRNGTYREGATKSVDYLDLDLDAGTYAAGTLIVHVDGDPTIVFENELEVTSGGGVVAAVKMLAQVTGPQRANAGTLTEIATPVAGFNAVDDDPLDAELGRNIETDAELRARFFEELARRGSGTVDAIKVDLENVSGVLSALVQENVTDVTDGSGNLPHSVHAYVRGGTDADVAAALFEAKGAGINTNGSTSVSHTDSQGTIHTVKFTRATQTNVYIAMTLTAMIGQYAGDTAVKQALVDWGDANLDVGNDVLINRLIAIVLGVPGVVDLTLTLGTAPSPVGTTNLVVGPTAFADLDTSRVSVTSSLVTSPP